ncbi:MAG: PDZ domain-containing protein [Verrucomicrobia bacterium]|nr:PDZ domain-containing protein [Verrucomicrobiota bacterium]
MRYLLVPLLAASALAQPAPPKAPAPPTPPSPPSRTAIAREPVSFLGVVTVPAAGALSEQLGLPPGFGLVVENVVPDSPAAAAGLKRYDILKTAGDQKLVSPDQLAALVRATKDGEEMTLTLLRKGKEEKVTAKLVKRAPEERETRRFRLRDLLGGSVPEDVMIESGPGENMRKRVIIRPGRDGEARVSARGLQSGRVQFKDDKGEIDLEMREGKTTLKVRKADGTLVFEGPINTDEERKKVPAEWLERVERIERERSSGRETGATGPEIDFWIDDGEGEGLPPVPPIPPRPAASAERI